MRIAGFVVGVKKAIKHKEVTFMINFSDHIVKPKFELCNPTEKLGRVSRACKVMSFSLSSFCCYKEVAEEGGVVAQSLLLWRGVTIFSLAAVVRN